MEAIDQQAAVLADQFANGNLTTVVAALKALDPIFAAALAARIVHLLSIDPWGPGDGLSDKFVALLCTVAERDSVKVPA